MLDDTTIVHLVALVVAESPEEMAYIKRAADREPDHDDHGRAERACELLGGRGRVWRRLRADGLDVRALHTAVGR